MPRPEHDYLALELPDDGLVDSSLQNRVIRVYLYRCEKPSATCHTMFKLIQPQSTLFLFSCVKIPRAA